MASRVTHNEALRRAHDALEAGLADDPLGQARGRLLQPLVLHTPAGAEAGWLVPVEQGGLLLGFVQLQLDGVFRRYASQHGRSSSSAGCPPIDDWLAPDVIADRARRIAPPGSSLATPMLTYDKHPDRIAWAVGVSTPDGRATTVLVAGTHAWQAPDFGD